MSTRFDALMVREKDGKSYFSRIGVAFPDKKGEGYMIYLDSIPAPVDGQFKIMLKPPQDKTGGSGDDRRGASGSGGGGFRDSSEIPFAPSR